MCQLFIINYSREERAQFRFWEMSDKCLANVWQIFKIWNVEVVINGRFMQISEPGLQLCLFTSKTLQINYIFAAMVFSCILCKLEIEFKRIFQNILCPLSALRHAAPLHLWNIEISTSFWNIISQLNDWSVRM